jgi:thymidylate synthase (FAD)
MLTIYREPVVTLIGRPQYVEPAHLPVQWKEEGTDGEKIAEFAGRLCYMSQSNPAGRSTAEYLGNILRQGHGSVFEHAVYVVLIEGVSRSLTEQMTSAQASYVAAVDRLMERYAWVEDRVHRRKMAREAARSVLPNGTETKIVVSGNVRAWRTMLELRLGEGAEREIRRLAVRVLETLRGEAPRFFADFELYQADDGERAGRVVYHKV